MKKLNIVVNVDNIQVLVIEAVYVLGAAKMNTKTINNMKKIFKENQVPGEKISPENFQGGMDASNVVMYVPKIKTNNEIFNIFETTMQKVPTLDKSKYQSCRYSKEYLKLILKILIEDDCSDSVTISVGKGMPLAIEDNNNGFILAPRFKDDGDIDKWHDAELI